MSYDMLDRQLGSYRIEELIERGGMVEVYRGYHVDIERRVAIKVIGRHLPADPLLNESFRREAKAIVQLRHPNIVQVYDFGEEGGGHYTVMEPIEGITLFELMDLMASGQRFVDRDDINFIMRQVANGLDYAHGRGVIHYDVNPGNILVKPNGQAFLTDFGLAMLKSREIGGPATARMPLGTPEYAAPEQALEAARVTPKSDIYSLGVVLYQLTTGSLPFTADSPIEVTLKHINETPPAPRQINSSLPRAVSQVILMAMAKDPNERFEKAINMVNALTHAWHIDNADDVMPLKSGQLQREGEREPLIPRTPLPTEDASAPRPGARPAQTTTQAKPTPRGAATQPAARKRRVSPLVVLALFVSLAVLGGIFGGRAAGLDAGSLLRGLLGRPATAPEQLVVATPTPPAEESEASSPPGELEPAGVTATPVITVEPQEAPIATPTPLNVPPLEPGTQALRLVDTSVMVYVPEGPFLMGTNDLSRPARERPQHEVMLSSYWIDQTEVTNAQYRQCVDAGACPFPTNTRNYADPRYANFPVAFVTWEAANAYCAYAGRAMGLDVRLPTEAQWEKAASWDPFTQTKRTYPWGEEFPTPERMRYVESLTVFQAAEVGTHPAGASAYGAFDMAGNMAEFVFDWSSEDYYSLPEAALDPQGPAEGSGRVIRGGSWAQAGSFAVTTRRTVVERETNGEEIGFRCAVNATTITPDNNVAFTPSQALGGAQAAIARAVAQNRGDQTVLNEWQAALISVDAMLGEGNSTDAAQQIDTRLDTLDVVAQAGNIPDDTALILRNTLRWVRSQLGASPPAETTGVPPGATPGTEPVGG